VDKISEEQYQKALFHARSQLAAIWNFANCYGLNNGVEQAIDESMKIVEQFGMVVRGKDIPIRVLDEPKSRITD
jgi:hypothetical protein